MTRIYASNPPSRLSAANSRPGSPTTQVVLDAVSQRVRHGATTPKALSHRERMDPDASILLLGIRGAGKTTLAILAASCTGFRLVDADQHFYQTTGLPRATFASQHGFEEYKAKEISLMKSLLEQNPWRCIIVCGPGSAEGTGQDLIKEFKKSHPVIYVTRDPAEVHRYLRTKDAAKINELVEMISPIYRSVSNFEFFNLSEHIESDQENDALVNIQLQTHPSLVLKHVEGDFIRLINAIRSQTDRPRVLQAEHSLSHLSPELRPRSYALNIPIGQVADVSMQLRGADLIADAVELEISAEAMVDNDGAFSHASATFITKQYYTLRRNVTLPVILHVLPCGRESIHLRQVYFQILSHGLRLGPEYLTLDLHGMDEGVNQILPQGTSTKIFGHYFDPSPSSDAWQSQQRFGLLEKADSLGCDLVRIVQPCTDHKDNIDVQVFAQKVKESRFSHIPLVAYNTGRDGRHSRFLNRVFTPVSHDILNQSSPVHSDETLTVQAAQKALYASFMLDKLVFGIFGSAVSAAVSPIMHNTAFEYCGMPHVYQTFQSSSLNDLKHLVYNESFGGASISAPFKKEIMSVLDYVSPEAQAIGAVNTLIPLRSRNLQSLVQCNRGGPVAALYGDNTDWIGLHTCIRKHLSPINAVKSRTTALILGAGGMARAAVYAALRLGVQTIFIHNRTIENAQKLVDQFNGKSFQVRSLDISGTGDVSPPRGSGAATPNGQTAGPAKVHLIPSMDEPWPSGFEPPTIIVGCISRASQPGQPQPHLVLPEAWLRSPTGGVLVELAYNPVETPLLMQFRSMTNKGWIPIHGLQVLPEQGIAQFELFTGRKAPQNLMRSVSAQQSLS